MKAEGSGSEGAVDLHLHSTASDGTYRPADVVEHARDRGLTTIALTDHDTTAGVAEAQDTGRRLGVRVVPGIELNTDHGRHEVHVLGYFIDLDDDALQAYLATVKEARVERARRIVENIRRLHGMPLRFEDVATLAGDASITRAHISRALVQGGFVATLEEARREYTGSDCATYVQRTTASPDEAVAIIRRAGGVPVLAHPGRIGSEASITHMMRTPIEGIEVTYPTHDEATRARFAALALEHGLIATGGSDCHGPKYGDVERIGTVAVPESVVEALEARRDAVRAGHGTDLVR